MNGADILVEMLIGYEVDTVFGVPGDTNVSFYEALRHREDEIAHVMARNEGSAGYIADAYGQFTNRPGITECPSRAGPMYTLTKARGCSCLSTSSYARKSFRQPILPNHFHASDEIVTQSTI